MKKNWSEFLDFFYTIETETNGVLEQTIMVCSKMIAVVCIVSMSYKIIVSLLTPVATDVVMFCNVVSDNIKSIISTCLLIIILILIFVLFSTKDKV